MDSKQNRRMDALLRVRVFLDEHPAPDEPAFANAREMLDDVLERLRDLAGTQYRGHTLSRAEVRRQHDQIGVLLDRHLRPIVTIARAQIGPNADAGVPVALRMPRLPINATRLLTVCDGMIEAVTPLTAMFVANGLPADFIARLASARDELERVMGSRAVQVGAHVHARQALTWQFLRGRRAVERLDALVRSSFRLEPAVLTAWRSAMRVRVVSGGAGARTAEEVTGTGSAADVRMMGREQRSPRPVAVAPSYDDEVLVRRHAVDLQGATLRREGVSRQRIGRLGVEASGVGCGG